jgi:hypothetical protein
MSDGSIRVTMSADLATAAAEIRKNKQATQELADALGLTIAETRKLQRELSKKERAEKAAVVTSQKMALTQGQVATATKGATLASQAGAAAMARMGIAANGALGPIGLVVGALSALAVGSFSVSGRMSKIVDEVANLAEGTGLSQRQVIALRHAVSSAGGDIAKTTAALTKFNEVMRDDLAGKTGPEVDRVLRETIARIEGIADPADRAAERMRVFGTRSATALAGLTSGNLAEAERQTASLADRIDRASRSSAEMDKAGTSLQRSLDELAVLIGDKMAPRVVQLTSALSGLADAATSVSGTWLGDGIAWWATGGVLGQAIGDFQKLETAINGPSRMQAEFARITAEQTKRLMEQREQMEQTRAEARAWLEGGWISAPAVQPGRAAADPAVARAAQQRARAEAEKVANARKAVADQFRRDDFAAMVKDDEQRRIQREQGAAELAQVEADEMAASRAAHDERMRQMAEERAAQQQMIELRRDVVTSAASGLAQIVEASSESAEAIATARILETIAYGSVAFARALAELGPIAGLPVAISTAAAVASQVAAIQAAPSRHMGSMAPDEGLLRVRNGERVTVEPATTAARPDRDRRGRSEVTMLQIDSRAYRAIQRATGRQDSIFGSRRREAVPA